MALSVQNTRDNGVARNDTFCIFDLVDILPGHMLLVNISTLIVSLLRLDGNQEHAVVAQRVLTEAEMRVVLSLLNTPTCCQQEVLLVSYSCAYEFLLKYMLSPDAQTTNEWNELVWAQWERLNRASVKKARRMEMRGVYNALYGLRQKLEQLGLTVRVRRDGYYLASLDNGEAPV